MAFIRMMLNVSFPVLVISLLLSVLVRPLSSHLDSLIPTPTGSPPRVLLLTAHPDDECLFFAPTILSLQDLFASAGGGGHSLDLYSLCLSAGDADGLGAVRKKELEGSLDVLGVPQGKRWVLDNPELQDNISARWSAEVIASVVRPYVLEYNITTILTFDNQGISAHPNHISLPYGITHLISTFPSNKIAPTPRLFTLITVPLVHKYIGLLGPILAKLDLHFAVWLERANLIPSETGRPRTPVAISGVTEYWTALQAMKQHSSQLVWFRWLYVSFSRYMWVNEWAEFVPAMYTTDPDAPSLVTG